MRGRRSISPQRPVVPSASPGQQSIIFHDVDAPLASIDDLQLSFQADLSTGITEAQALAGLSIVSGSLVISPPDMVTAGASTDFDMVWFVGPAMAADVTMYSTWKTDTPHGGLALAGFYYYPDDETTVPEAPSAAGNDQTGFVGEGIGGAWSGFGVSRNRAYTTYKTTPTKTTISASNFVHGLVHITQSPQSSFTGITNNATRSTVDAENFNPFTSHGNGGRLDSTHRLRAAIQLTRVTQTTQNNPITLHALELHYNVKT